MSMKLDELIHKVFDRAEEEGVDTRDLEDDDVMDAIVDIFVDELFKMRQSKPKLKAMKLG